jgi:hypothetical protein
MSDARLSKQTVNTRKSRASQNRQVTEDREQTDAERLELFRAAHAQAALPDIPPIPGFHVIWLASNNPRDSLAMRMRQGYTPVLPEDVKGFEFVTDSKGGVSDGLIRVNEMVAYKLPSSLYNLYMRENHHYKPAAEETKLTDTATSLKRAAEAQGAGIDEGDGVEALRDKLDSVPVPDFSDIN